MPLPSGLKIRTNNMPLHKLQTSILQRKFSFGKITESYEDLFDKVVLNDAVARLGGMKSELHQRFLSVRKLLQEASYNDFDLSYDEPKAASQRRQTHFYHPFLSVLCNNHQRPDGRYRYQLQREK
jgi:hypothetical protein